MYKRQRPIFSEGGKNQEIQTRYLQDASYIRLKNFQLGYTFPAKWMKSMGSVSYTHLDVYKRQAYKRKN